MKIAAGSSSNYLKYGLNVVALEGRIIESFPCRSQYIEDLQANGQRDFDVKVWDL